MRLRLDSPCFFIWTFQKRGSIAPGHVSTLFFPANEKLRGIEHAQLKKEPKRRFWALFGPDPFETWWEEVSRRKENQRKTLLHVYMRIRCQFCKILKGQCILFVCAIIFYLFELEVVFFGHYFLIFWFSEKILKIGFLDKTESVRIHQLRMKPNSNIKQLKASGGCKSYDRQKHAI
jgi:hypothetical protein